MRQTLTDRYNLAVRACTEKDVEISRLKKELQLANSARYRTTEDFQAMTKVAIQARVDRHQMLNDLHGLAVSYAPPKRGPFARFLDKLAASF